MKSPESPLLRARELLRGPNITAALAVFGSGLRKFNTSSNRLIGTSLALAAGAVGLSGCMEADTGYRLHWDQKTHTAAHPDFDSNNHQEFHCDGKDLSIKLVLHADLDRHKSMPDYPACEDGVAEPGENFAPAIDKFRSFLE